MLFNSYPFLILYLPTIFVGFFYFARYFSNQVARVWLLLGSLWFYAYWDIRFLPLLACSVCFNYSMGNLISISKNKKIYLLFSLMINLFFLFYFKYSSFFMQLFVATNHSAILPLGISFFTFTQIAYLVDMYQNKIRQCDFISYGLFVTIFPHLIAGPLLHHKEMTQQFQSPQFYQFSYPNIAQGVFLFIIGLSKKVLLADALVPFVVPIFDEGWLHPGFLQAWIGAIAYTLQLYFDFSGYSDMAIGLALLFNLQLPINFNSPYQADSLIDFWRRWHITLSRFLRDYLYIPMGGNRKGQPKSLQNLLITMTLGGIWHGAGWTFITWGIYHGVFLMINHLWRNFSILIPSWLSQLMTLLTVICGWVIFRSPNLSTAMTIFKGMVGMNGIILPEKYANHLYFLKPYGIVFQQLAESTFRLTDVMFLILLLVGVLYLPNSQKYLQNFKHSPIRWSFVCSTLFFLAFIELDQLAEFLYYQF